MSVFRGTAHDCHSDRIEESGFRLASAPRSAASGAGGSAFFPRCTRSIQRTPGAWSLASLRATVWTEARSRGRAEWL